MESSSSKNSSLMPCMIEWSYWKTNQKGGVIFEKNNGYSLALLKLRPFEKNAKFYLKLFVLMASKMSL